MGTHGVTMDQLKEGMFIKAMDKDGRHHRVEIVELANGGEVPVKVRWVESTKKKKDSWMRLRECRLIRSFSVDWDDFECKLPTAQDPESRAARKQVFAAWDTGRKKYLSLDQLQAGVKKLLSDEFGEDVEETELAVQCAWRAARNLAPPRKNKALAAKVVDAKEFHAFIVALRYYIELAELFEHIDALQEDDQRLSHRECKKALTNLEEWGITQEKLAEKFKGYQPWTPVIKFEDFAKWCVEERWSHLNLNMELDSDDDEVQLELGRADLRTSVGISLQELRQGEQDTENRKKVMEVFAMTDANKSGTISEEELVQVFTQLNSKITPEVAKHLFRLADSNQDGQVDYEEFCLWLFR